MSCMHVVTCMWLHVCMYVAYMTLDTYIHTYIHGLHFVSSALRCAQHCGLWGLFSSWSHVAHQLTYIPASCRQSVLFCYCFYFPKRSCTGSRSVIDREIPRCHALCLFLESSVCEITCPWKHEQPKFLAVAGVWQPSSWTAPSVRTAVWPVQCGRYGFCWSAHDVRVLREGVAGKASSGATATECRVTISSQRTSGCDSCIWQIWILSAGRRTQEAKTPGSHFQAKYGIAKVERQSPSLPSSARFL